MSTPESPAPAAGKPPWLLMVGVLAAFWVVYLIVAGPRRLDDIDGPESGRAVDFNWSLRDLDGGEVNFDRFRGKALFVNVWATWCPPCVAEMPSIARLASVEDLKGKVEFICIATDESMDAVRSFVRGKGWPMTILHATALPPVFLTDGIPATFLIAPDGRLAYMREGAAEWDAPEVVRKLRDLASRPATPPGNPG
ncbi:TlpA disulfide reductase family protein [Paludisphaera sp.]|uniref:TlpA family protein disulfide reductase n=1 Tax=Paludisphaera sp. TaxID=2017432 RepID=UPI00301B74DE